MAFQQVVDTAEVSIIFQQNNEILANVFHAKKTGGYNQSDIDDLADAVDDLVLSELIPEMTLNCEYLRTEVRGLDNENDLTATNATNTGSGTDGSAGLPNSVTLSLKKSSGLTGRSARGRWYFAGMPANALSTDENQFIQASADDALAAVEGLRLGVNVTDWTAVIVSRFTGGAARTAGLTFPWIATVLVNRFVDTQRRRLSR